MPLFLDIHSLNDPATLDEVTKAHDADLRAQEISPVTEGALI